MNKIKKNLELLTRLESLTQSHDWYYQRSDDNRYYEKGRTEARAIQLLMEECNNNDLSIMANEIYNSNKK